MRVLQEMNPLESVLTDEMRYYLGEDPDKPWADSDISRVCQRIVVSMENGPMAMIPFAVCIAHDNTVNLVNLSRCSEVQMKDKLSSGSHIEIVPAGVVPGPGHPDFKPD